MNIFTPQSKNILTLAWLVAFALLGTIIRTILKQVGYTILDDSSVTNPFISALFPMIIAGVPITVIAGFIFGIFTLGREETKLGRGQAGALLIITLILGYLASFWMVNGGLS